MKVYLNSKETTCGLNKVIDLISISEDATMTISIDNTLGRVQLNFTSKEWLMFLETAFAQIALSE